ncbi:MAG: hypothetical protein ACRD0J_09000 [Acidimicrobiales bacterium]
MNAVADIVAPTSSRRRGRPGTRGTRTSIGVELDGSVLRAVTVSGGKIVDYRTYRGSGPGDAIRRWRSRARPRGRVLLAWAGPSHVRQTRLREYPDAAMRAAISAKAAEMFPIEAGETDPLAGAVFGLPDDHPEGLPVVVGALDTPVGEEILGALAGMDAMVTVAPLLQRVDGLHLAIRSSIVEMCLVRGSVPLLVRSLGTPGLDSLGWGPEDGTPLDSAAAALLSGYVASLVAEVFQTAAFWSGQAEMPRDLFVSGPGASLPGLETALREAGQSSPHIRLRPRAAAPDPSIDAGAVSVAERVACATAVTAATTELGPWAAITPIGKAEAEAAKTTQARHRWRLAWTVIGLIVLLAVCLSPIVLGRRRVSAAQANLVQAKTGFAGLSKFYDLGQQVKAAESAERSASAKRPVWAPAYGVIDKSIPPGTTLSNLAVKQQGTVLSVSASVTAKGAPFVPVAAWLTNLGHLGATNIVPQGFANSKGTLTWSVSFDLPVGKAVAK